MPELNDNDFEQLRTYETTQNCQYHGRAARLRTWLNNIKTKSLSTFDLFLVFIDLSASLVIKALVVNLYSWLWLLLCKREQKIWTIWNVSNYSNVTKVM